MAGKVEGSFLAVIFGADGMPVEVYRTDEAPAAEAVPVGQPGMAGPGKMDPDVVGAEVAQVVKEADRAACNLGIGGAGETSEITILTNICTIMVRRINPEYFMALVTAPGANLGKGRFYLKQAASRVANEF